MSDRDTAIAADDPQMKGLYRLGAVSAFLVFLSYLALIGLFVPVFPFPEEAQPMLEYLQGKTTIWWAIIGVSAFTDLLYGLVAFVLFKTLKGVNLPLMVLGAGCKLLFVVLEMAASWPNFAALISLSDSFDAATNEAQRTSLIAAAEYATSVVNSTLLGFYAILIPGLGSLFIGLVMMKGIFSKATAYIAVIAGVMSVVSVIGPLFSSVFDAAIILTSSLSTIWFLLVGIKLNQLSK